MSTFIILLRSIREKQLIGQVKLLHFGAALIHLKAHSLI